MNNTCFYNKRLQTYANKLRREMTKSEACLWKYVLRAGQMNGFQFRRQRPVLEYIADFMCKELKLIIEIDGITHDGNSGQERDCKKERDLIQAGFRVIRFTDEEVFTNIQGVAKKIESVIEKIKETTPCIPRRRGTK